jgi:transposase
VPAHFIAHRHLRETLACRCGEYVVTADGPTKWVEKCQYAPSFVAHVITAKCADSIPVYRQGKELQRIGVPVARSTMTDLFHRAAIMLEPLVERIAELIRQARVVHGDETPKKMLAPGHCKTGYIWVFTSRGPKPLVLYRFALTRSGKTPEAVLGGSTGRLVVDAYTGYNTVTGVDGRARSGCHAHLRRGFFDAQATAPHAARKAMDFVLGLYRVERDAEEAGILGTAEHLALRKKRSAPVRRAFRKWLKAEQPQHAPKSPLGEAIRYALNQWTALGRFLQDAQVPLDNNVAEGALRRVALGRRNFLFVGNEAAGQNLAGLYSLVATCEANDVNPVEYLADVLARMNDHPHSRLDELLPHNWQGPPGAAIVESRAS